MKHILFTISVCFIFLSGCKKENNTQPIEPKNAGSSKITTELIINSGVGFSFGYGTTIVIANPNNIKPDMILLVQRSAHGEILGVFLSSIDLTPMFSLIEEFNNLDSAKKAFDEFKEVPANLTFVELAIPAKKNQVWAVKTLDDKYAKILITNTLVNYDSTKPDYYGEADFDWVYQPNGSNKF